MRQRSFETVRNGVDGVLNKKRKLGLLYSRKEHVIMVSLKGKHIFESLPTNYDT